MWTKGLFQILNILSSDLLTYLTATFEKNATLLWLDQDERTIYVGTLRTEF